MLDYASQALRSLGPSIAAQALRCPRSWNPLFFAGPLMGALSPRQAVLCSPADQLCSSARFVAGLPSLWGLLAVLTVLSHPTTSPSPFCPLDLSVPVTPSLLQGPLLLRRAPVFQGRAHPSLILLSPPLPLGPSNQFGADPWSPIPTLPTHD